MRLIDVVSSVLICGTNLYIYLFLIKFTDICTEKVIFRYLLTFKEANYMLDAKQMGLNSDNRSRVAHKCRPPSIWVATFTHLGSNFFSIISIIFF